MKSIAPYKKNFLISTGLLTLCMGVLVVILVTGDVRVEQSDKWANHSRTVILEAEELGTQIEGLLASQRVYLLNGTDAFRDRYNEKKILVAQRLVSLSNLVTDNESQALRLEKLEKSLDRFVQSLDARIIR